MNQFGIRDSEEPRPSKLKKAMLSKHALSGNQGYVISTTVFNKSIRAASNSAKQEDNAGKLPEQSFTRHAVTRHAITAGGHMGDGKLPTWHYQMEQAFEGFLLRLDDIFLALRRDVTQANSSPDLTGYKDICEKLRTEILIALDRLEFVAMPNNNYSKEKCMFLEKLNGIKSKLSVLRWQYHNAIKELGDKIF